MFECETPVQGDWVTIVLRPDRSLVGFDANVPENVPARSERAERPSRVGRPRAAPANESVRRHRGKR